MKEKRKFVSIKGLNEVLCKVQGSAEGLRKIEVKNISTFGINLYFDAPLDTGTKLEIHLRLPPNSEKILLCGKVIWQLTEYNDQYSTGIRFEEIEDQIKEKITKCMQAHAVESVEKREFTRCVVVADAIYYLIDKKAHKFKAQTVDISVGGMRLLFNEEIQKDDCIGVSFSLPDDGGVLEFEAKVFWVLQMKGRKFEAGVSFTKISDEDRERIKNYVENWLKS